MNTKRQLGQYYTVANPFHHPLFYSWLDLIPEDIKSTKWLEPFCGSNNIPDLLDSLELKTADNLSWSSYDIELQDDCSSPIEITQQDTLASFPEGYSICITNPPYLAKNSAKRRGLSYPATEYDDLYKYCISKCLENTQYLAAIIPQSFITCRNSELKNRLYGIVTLNIQMFEDTDCPVCLALFQKDETTDFYISESSSLQIDNYSSFSQYKLTSTSDINLNFNSPHGKLGLKAVDNTIQASIEFCSGDAFSPNSIKNSSRSYTRIHSSAFDNIKDFDSFINDLNVYLADWRAKTNDIFLTSFKGLRRDSCYRRRLDWSTAANLIKVVYESKHLQ